ncbi:non-heme iron oxygenase ferredoxin subunit [Goodfellowiella coeruleoviolacea]|uniref:3-phenylpropionate/trans-cinnamate dioxygenase ferredoxin subunit n=1 Tax=Goodfellowiella coeruleoviolacea TaxID=334858 RepID=A0AAE3GKV5_9PSEU|nr:non-heme iron oxygenase ferredoxin subunit [Goodfellowiella coeruleoviolacea]MCP2169488.1 3-phenylpropionate/trans-cinnamate dioxygenase ferredoxin subunit [Goodfellowiella coeruleoviolacea]
MSQARDLLTEPGQWQRVCSLTELDQGKPAGFEIDDTPVVLVRDGEQVHALHDVCTHAEVALSEGEVSRGGIECWLHGSCFDLRTGAPSSLPATEPVNVYPVHVAGDDVYVDLSSPKNQG